jgi:hypothetical protein
LLVSPLQAGDQIALSTLPASEAAAVSPETCLQIVVFSPECPFCQQAASRESKTLTEASRAKRLWYTDTETALLPYFISEHLHRQPGISADLVQELKIQAVPALFVVGPAGDIRWVGAYYGDETDQELTGRCTADRNPEQRT